MQRSVSLHKQTKHPCHCWPMFFERKDQLSVQDGCLLWGLDVVVPKVYRANVLIQLHEGHPGATRMKALSRMYVWWPGITVRDCLQCQTHQSTPPVAPLHSLGKAPYCFLADSSDNYRFIPKWTLVGSAPSISFWKVKVKSQIYRCVHIGINRCIHVGIKAKTLIKIKSGR